MKGLFTKSCAILLVGVSTLIASEIVEDVMDSQAIRNSTRAARLKGDVFEVSIDTAEGAARINSSGYGKIFSMQFKVDGDGNLRSTVKVRGWDNAPKEALKATEFLGETLDQQKKLSNRLFKAAEEERKRREAFLSTAQASARFEEALEKARSAEVELVELKRKVAVLEEAADEAEKVALEAKTADDKEMQRLKIELGAAQSKVKELESAVEEQSSAANAAAEELKKLKSDLAAANEEKEELKTKAKDLAAQGQAAAEATEKLKKELSVANEHLRKLELAEKRREEGLHKIQEDLDKQLRTTKVVKEELEKKLAVALKKMHEAEQKLRAHELRDELERRHAEEERKKKAHDVAAELLRQQQSRPNDHHNDPHKATLADQLWSALGYNNNK